MPARCWTGAIALAAFAAAGIVVAQDKKEDKRGGTVIGLLTAKGPAFIEVKADGEEKARKYVPHWVGGLPKDGGGPDKKLVEQIKTLVVGSRLKVKWEFDERPRVLAIEVLEKPKSNRDK
jgi:hypothetical protein